MKSLLIGLSALTLAACSSTPKEEPKEAAAPTMSMEAKQVAIQEEAPHVAEIKFKKGSSTLSAEARKQLQDLMKSARSTGKIEEVKVVAWSDAEYPSEEGKELPQKDLRLADQRNRAIENYMTKQSEDAKVTAFNMAQSPSAFSEWIGSDEARIKKTLENAGIPTGEARGADTPKASRAIIMIETEKE